MASELLGCTVSGMAELRDAKISVLLAPSTVERLDAYRSERRWTRSTAIAALVEEGLDRHAGQDHEERQ